MSIQDYVARLTEDRVIASQQLAGLQRDLAGHRARIEELEADNADLRNRVLVMEPIYCAVLAAIGYAPGTHDERKKVAAEIRAGRLPQGRP